MSGGSHTYQGIGYQTLVGIQRLLEFVESSMLPKKFPKPLEMIFETIDEQESQDITIFYDEEKQLVLEQVKKSKNNWQFGN